jgi:hypothetical protein
MLSSALTLVNMDLEMDLGAQGARNLINEPETLATMSHLCDLLNQRATTSTYTQLGFYDNWS